MSFWEWEYAGPLVAKWQPDGKGPALWAVIGGKRNEKEQKKWEYKIFYIRINYFNSIREIQTQKLILTYAKEGRATFVWVVYMPERINFVR